MAQSSLHDAFIDELRDAYDGERQLMKALPRMAKAASSASLRSAFEGHLRETKGQVAMLEARDGWPRNKDACRRFVGAHAAAAAGQLQASAECGCPPLGIRIWCSFRAWHVT